LVEICEAIVEGRLNQIRPQWDPQFQLCLIATSGRTKGKKGWYKGYPERYKIGLPVHGLDQISEECLVFHSGTGRNDNGQLVTTGGRVLCIVGRGDTLEQARTIAYREMDKVSFEGIYYRSDIGIS
jgi:phosphoribosylamine---glycine ligase